LIELSIITHLQCHMILQKSLYDNEETFIIIINVDNSYAT